MDRLAASVARRFLATTLEPPRRLPEYIPSDDPRREILLTRPDGIEITASGWHDAMNSSSAPTPCLSFGARPGPKWKGKGYKGGGMGSLNIYPVPDEPGTFSVGQVAVMQPYRRSGIATDLYRAAVRWLHAHNGRLRQGWITSDAAARMWARWRAEGLVDDSGPRPTLRGDRWA